MKNYILVSAIVTLGLSVFGQERNTLWLEGAGASSSLDWDNTVRELEKDYDLFRVISLDGLPQTAYPLEGNVEEETVTLDDHIRNDDRRDYDNILGIGHDFGGIVLRNLEKHNENLTAMILDGTPNQGSEFVEWAIKDGANGRSKAERVIEDVNRIKRGDSCDDCDVVGAFEDWIRDLKNGEDQYTDLTPNSPIMNDLNQNPPQIPFAIFWGSKPDVTFTELLSNYGFTFTGDQDQFTSCYESAQSRAREQARYKYLTAISKAGNLFTDVLDFAGALEGDISAGDFFSALATFISESRQDIIDILDARRELDLELDRLIRCELANQLLSIEWLLALQNGEEPVILIEGDNPSEAQCFDYCRDDCDDDQTTRCFDNCMLSCLNGQSPLGGQRYVPLYKESDGVLLREEQLLSGSVHDYHLSNTNHFQETNPNHGALLDHFQDLFDGNKGPEFMVNRL